MCKIASVAAAAVAAACREEGRRPRLLDVGTGTGALLRFYEEAGVAPADVTGVDLCGAMLAHARTRFPDATFIEGDFLDVRVPEASPVATADGGDPVANARAAGGVAAGSYDAIVFNAVFANLYDQGAALAHAAKLLRPGGAVVISHPLGGAFVRQLRDSDPTVVPNVLPDENALRALLLGAPPLRLASYRDDPEPPLYLATLSRE